MKPVNLITVKDGVLKLAELYDTDQFDILDLIKQARPRGLIYINDFDLYPTIDTALTNAATCTYFAISPDDWDWWIQFADKLHLIEAAYDEFCESATAEEILTLDDNITDRRKICFEDYEIFPEQILSIISDFSQSADLTLPLFSKDT
ncbi:hypothetical protein [Stenoxybacter acetivorans]|uniref:hypothetical protein n=1 Tax=Stenoxybacter acetivorans TaxID=422441 RepID=UPI00056680C5|nr:hypothetical protein [Stenoxybacter acetivorans]